MVDLISYQTRPHPEIVPAIAQGHQTAGQRSVVTLDVVPPCVTRMRGSPVELDDQAVAFVQHIAVFPAPGTRGCRLPFALRQAMWEFDPFHVAILERRIDASPFVAQYFGDLSAKTHPRALTHSPSESLLGGEPAANAAGDPAAGLVR